MKPEDLIGPAAAKALAEHFTLTPIAKPLPEVVTEEEAYEIAKAGGFTCLLDKHVPMYDIGREHLRRGAEAFVLRWLRARLEALPDYGVSEDLAKVENGDDRQLYRCIHRADTFKALTGRDW